MMMKATLVVMAAGMGSRYGGLKQIDPVGPCGELIIDYSIYDALKAGFGKVVFIIKEDTKESFYNTIGKRIERIIDTAYVYQKLEDMPKGYNPPAERTKPWGTAHAVLSCREEVNTAFAVINADDYYGATSFKLIHDYLVNVNEDAEFYQYSMVGFKVENTLTDHGHVARGICSVDNEHHLKTIDERTKIQKFGNDIKYTTDDTNWIDIPKGTTVSMNTWGFTPSIFEEIDNRFIRFLEDHKDNLLKAEFFLPSVVDCLIEEKKAQVKVITSNEQWYGVTYKEDKDRVKKAIQELVNRGIYPENLWGEINED